MKDMFADSPTVGSNYNMALEKDVSGVIQNSDQRTQRIGQQGVGGGYSGYDDANDNARWEDYQTPKRNKWGKIRKFFIEVIKPVLIFISNFLNAIANLKCAFTPNKAAA